MIRLCYHRVACAWSRIGLRHVAVATRPSTVLRSIEASVTLDELAKVYKQHANSFEGRDFHALLQPHLIVLEKFLWPYVNKLAESPLHTAAILHVVATYDRPLAPKLRDAVTAALKSSVAGSSDAWTVRRRSSWLPDSVLAVLDTPVQPVQYAPSAAASAAAVNSVAVVAAALAHHGISHGDIWTSLVTAITHALLAVTPGDCMSPALSFLMSAARAGVTLQPETMSTLVPHLVLSPTHDNVARWSPMQFAIHVAYLWACSVCCRDTLLADGMLRAVLNEDSLRAHASSMQAPTRLQLHQLHAAVMPHVRPELPPLPAFVWDAADKAAVPVEKPPTSHAVLQVSSHLRRMRVRHRVQYIADGVVLDIAIPSLRVAVHVAYASDPAPAAHAFLRAHGWHIATLRYDEWRRLAEGERDMLLATMLQQRLQADSTRGHGGDNIYNDAAAGRSAAVDQLT